MKSIKSEAAQVPLLEMDSQSQVTDIRSCVSNKPPVHVLQACLRAPKPLLCVLPSHLNIDSALFLQITAAHSPKSKQLELKCFCDNSVRQF